MIWAKIVLTKERIRKRLFTHVNLSGLKQYVSNLQLINNLVPSVIYIKSILDVGLKLHMWAFTRPFSPSRESGELTPFTLAGPPGVGRCGQGLVQRSQHTNNGDFLCMVLDAEREVNPVVGGVLGELKSGHKSLRCLLGNSEVFHGFIDPFCLLNNIAQAWFSPYCSCLCCVFLVSSTSALQPGT